MMKTINLALQGGGAHGAYTWGVIDKIMEDGRLEIDGLSATSAGAMNAAVYAYGRMMGDRDGAREALHNYWQDIARAGELYSPIKSNPFEAMMIGWQDLDHSMGYFAFDSFIRMFSPYQFNPLNINPLQEILQKHVNFDALNSCECVKLFICATNVKTNRIKVFTNEEVTAAAVMASACLPTLFQAVEVKGEFYWDGGYMGNPAIYPLFYSTNTDDMVVVHINPIERDTLPTEPYDILNRVNEISFNSSLLREFRAIAFIQKIIEEGWIKDEFRAQITHNRFFMHSIRSDKALSEYTVASKLSPDWNFLTHLRDKGREAAEEWLTLNYEHLGKRSTIDLKGEYLDEKSSAPATKAKVSDFAI
jgi:NTE family protein